MNAITACDVLLHWPVSPPLDLEQIELGTNNRSYLVKSGNGIFVLKQYRNVDSSKRLRFEHALLTELRAVGLPFAVPWPLLTTSRDTSVEITCDGDVYRVSLSHHISGRAATFGNPSEGYRCGEALAILDQSLGTIALDPDIAHPEAFGDLSSIHPCIPHPLAKVRKVYGDHALSDILCQVERRWQLQMSNWSRQIIHGDFYPSNTIVDSDEVAGILDFEFSGLGYRAMDFAIGLAAFSTKQWDDGCTWDLVEVFARGYFRHSPLTGEELSAMPTLLLMREASSFIHWLGRMEQGLTTFDDMQIRASRLLSLHRWLDTNQSRLVRQLGHISSE